MGPHSPAPPDLALVLQVLQDVREGLQELRAEVQALQEARGSPAVAVTVQEAARALGCSSRQVYRLLGQRKLRAAPRQGRKRMVTRASIEALLYVPEPTQASPKQAKPKQWDLAALDRIRV